MNFILRPWIIEDLDSLVKYANNYKIAKNLTMFNLRFQTITTLICHY